MEMSPTVLTLSLVIFGMAVAIIAFFLRRIVGTVDRIEETTTKLALDMKDRPTLDKVKTECKEASQNRMVVHERDHHHNGHNYNPARIS